jgi:hypothetical protein
MNNLLKHFFTQIEVPEQFWPCLMKESGIVSIDSLVLFVMQRQDVEKPVTNDVQRRLVAGVSYLIARHKHNADSWTEVATRATTKDFWNYILHDYAPSRESSESANKIVQQES